MRRILFSIATLVLVTSSAPSFAREYAWCARTDSNGFNGDCSFTTRQQCEATVSGQAGECRQNPRVAFDPRAGRLTVHRNY
jgi:hypothetical protein